MGLTFARTTMSQPWLKKNPFMSMWLSGANAVAGSARAQAQRQTGAAIQKATRYMFGLWTGAMKPPAAAKRTRRKSR